MLDLARRGVADRHVAALLAMTGTGGCGRTRRSAPTAGEGGFHVLMGIDKNLKAGIIIDEGRALPVNGGPSRVTRSNRGLGASAVTSFYYLPG